MIPQKSGEASEVARTYHHMLKLARTIADLADSGMIAPLHLAEALLFQLIIMVG